MLKSYVVGMLTKTVQPSSARGRAGLHVMSTYAYMTFSID
jgi:hypothetical protein